MLQRIMKSSAADATKWAKRQLPAVQAQFARVQTQWRQSRQRYIESEAAAKSGAVVPTLRAASATASTSTSLKYKHVTLTASGIFRAVVWMNDEAVGLGSFRDELSAARSSALALDLHHKAVKKGEMWERPDMEEWYTYVLTKFPDSQCAARKKTQWRQSRQRYIEGEAAMKSGIVEPILRAASPTGSTPNSLKYKHVRHFRKGLFGAWVKLNGENVGLGSFRDEFSAGMSSALALDLHHKALEKRATWKRPDMKAWYAYVLQKYPEAQCKKMKTGPKKKKKGAAPKKKKGTAEKSSAPTADYYVRTPLRHVTIASSVSY